MPNSKNKPTRPESVEKDYAELMKAAGTAKQPNVTVPETGFRPLPIFGEIVETVTTYGAYQKPI